MLRVTDSDYRAEADLPLLDAFVGSGDLVERISFRHHLNFAGGGDLERFIEVFAAVLLAAENPDAAHDEIAGMDRQRFVLETHEHQPASGRRPAMLSAMASTELLVPRITSAPPAAARPLPSRTISSAPSSRIILSLFGECETATVVNPAALAYWTARCPRPPMPTTSLQAGAAPNAGPTKPCNRRRKSARPVRS
jgi:hypothetical protein